MSISIIIPCKNEQKNIVELLNNLILNLKNLNAVYEILIVDDFSSDLTSNIIKDKFSSNKQIKLFFNNEPGGLGQAIKLGIKESNCENISFMMADASDSVDDLINYINIMKQKDIDAVLGSRFIQGSKISNYPIKKLILNRIFNKFTQLLFFSKYNDFTNAFKIYKKETLLNLFPIVSENFNVFLELPLKVISRGYKYKIVPISWNNRKFGEAKFKIKELGSKYFFTLLYCYLEKILLKKRK